MLKIPSIIHFIPFLESINKAALPPNEPKGSSGDISTAYIFNLIFFPIMGPIRGVLKRTPNSNYSFFLSLSQNEWIRLTTISRRNGYT